MAELLVRVKDKPLSGDKRLDAQRTMRGDVIVAMPDSHDWTKPERENPEWLIVQCPKMSMDEAQALCAPEPFNEKEPNKPYLRRLFKIDLDAADASLKQSVSEGLSRIVAAVEVEKTVIVAAQVEKPKPLDETIIGPVNEQEIGPK